MAANSTLLCIHRDPDQLSSLKERGYDLVTASNGCEGLRLFMSQPVDAIVLEYRLGLLDGATVASTIKQVRPEIPIVMLTDDLEFPDGALKSVDAIVTKSDGAHFLWATVHFVLNMKPAVPKPAVPNKALETTQPAPNLRLTSKSGKAHARPHKISEAEDDEKLRPFSPGVWKGIRSGSLKF